jgi:3',5'-cyclic-AMP phosphodiesterase
MHLHSDDDRAERLYLASIAHRADPFPSDDPDEMSAEQAERAEAASGDVDRRGFLKCMAWAGAGIVWTVAGGVLSSRTIAEAATSDATGAGSFSFAQISDSHIGFKNVPNQDVTATLQQAVTKVNALPQPPAFILHTGDLSHLSTPDQFDTVAQIVKGAKASQSFFIPGEHDTFVDNGKAFLDRFGQGTTGNGWRSFDFKGVHLIGLVNVWNVKGGGFGTLGQEQLDWLKQDVAGLSSSTPIVVYAHVPLWAVYPQWGWGTDDAEQALTLLRRFGSVTVLNGHIHQVLQKVEGNVTFHTAASTAYPQPAPGMGPAPGPLKVVPQQLLGALGIRQVSYVQKQGQLVVVDHRIG